MRIIYEQLINQTCPYNFNVLNAISVFLQSEERGGTPSRRSKSEGPPVVPNGRAYPIATEIDGTTRKQVHNCQMDCTARSQSIRVSNSIVVYGLNN